MVTTLTGTNTFILADKLKQLVADFVATEGDMALERIEGDEATFERISESLTSLPFLSNKKMVIIRQGSGNKRFMEAASDLLSTLPETTDVILVEPKLDKRSAYYKYLRKSTDYQEFKELDPAGLTRWLVQRAKDRQGSISQADASLLVSRVGANQQLLASELEKLMLYSSNVSKGAILALTEATPQSTVFELLEAAFNGNTKKALELYEEQRALKVEPQQIIAMLSWQLHILALIKAASQRTPEAIASEAKISPYVIKKSAVIARKLTIAELKRLVAQLVELDGRSKRETFNIDDALRLYLLSLST